MKSADPDPASCPEHISAPSRRKVRRVFAACGLLLLGQYGLMFIVGEPYPALILPAFRGTGYVNGRVTVRKITVDFLSDERVMATCPHFELLRPIPDAFHSAIARNVLSPLAEHSSGDYSGSPLRILFCRMFPGFHKARRDHMAERVPESLRSWLEQRARILAPDATIDRVTIRWNAVIYDMNHRPPTAIDEEFIGELTILLENATNEPKLAAAD